MKFKEFLRRAFGGSLYADRLRMFRKFLISDFFNFGNPTKEERENLSLKMIESLSRNGLAKPDDFFTWLRMIKSWREFNRVQQRKDAAKKRWEKQKPS